MPHVPPELKERLKREVSVQRLAEARGVKLRRSGKELIGICPFHKDSKPSLRIDPVENRWHCFGCDRKGDVIEWMMCAEGISFNHAVELLKRDYLPQAAPLEEPPPKHGTVRKLSLPIERSADDRALLQQVVSYYTKTLKESPAALKYLEARGLKSSEMIDRFRLGFANRTIGYYLPDKNRAAGAELRERLQKVGIYRESGHEHFSGSVVIPILSPEGEVMQMYGRKITRALREGTPEHLYLSGPRRGVWNEEALIASKEIILCEALIDALTFWCAGFRHVTTSYGVNGFTEDIKAAFKKYGTKKIYIAYDHDDAGDKAAKAHGAELLSMGIECFRVQFPRGQDANEFAVKNQPAVKFLTMYLNRAEWLGKGQRPQVSVIEPTPTPEPEEIEPPTATEEKTKPAAKKKNIEPEPSELAEQEIMATPAAPEIKAERILLEVAEPVFSLAAHAETESHEEPGRAEEPPRSAPLPSVLATTVDVPIEIKDGEVIVWQGERRYRVRGLQKNMSYELLRVNVMVSGKNLRGQSGFHVDTLDLYSARQRTVFIKQAAGELHTKEEIIHDELGHVLQKLEELQHQQIDKELKPEEKPAEMATEDHDAAMKLLRDPRLLDRVLEDFDKCGVVGEETNKRVSYLAAVSRLLEKPLAVVVQSSSAAGKSSLMEAVLEFIPEEQRESYSAMTGQSLFYMGEKNLKHKILAIAEQQGAERASYPLKLLQSEGVLKIASTGKDPVNGKQVTHEYTVEGPVMIFLTTTAQNVDEELMNRAIVLAVNEEREQTRAIHRQQREARTLEGHLARRKRAKIVRLHRNVQRLLRPIVVVNNHPVAEFPDYMTRTRRDHAKLLTLIETIALLHQHQREIKSIDCEGETLEYIEATEDDVKLAEELAEQVLKPSLHELPPQTRKLLGLIVEMVKQESERLQIEAAECCFTRRTVREYTRWGDTQLREHLRRLEELEYLRVRRGGNQGQLFVYQLRPTEEAEASRSGNFAGPEEHFAGGARELRGSSKNEESPATTRPEPSTSRVRGNSSREHEEEDAQNVVVGIASRNGKVK